jgi:hypothetical protein
MEIIKMLNKNKKIKELQSQLNEWVQALGLLSVLNPTMEIDIEDPIGMATNIGLHVTDRIAKLESRKHLLTVHDITTKDNTLTVVWEIEHA